MIGDQPTALCDQLRKLSAVGAEELKADGFWKAVG